MKDNVRKNVYSRLLRRFWKSMIIYSVLLLGLTIFGYLLCSQRVWHSYDAWYPAVHWLHAHIMSVFLAGLLMGGVVISCFQFYYITKLMGRITEAVDAVYKGGDELIELPDTLQEIELQLNHIMTNIKNSRYEAKKAEQQKSDMIMYMAHDLKTPLTSVIGYLSILQEESGISDDLKKKYISIVMEKAYRLEELVNEFFEVTRFNFSHMPLELSKVNLSRMIEQILYEFRPIFREKGLECHTEIEPDIYFMCDVGQMERVFDNLLRNAANYSYPNTSIDIVVSACEEKNVKIRMKNHGKTIPAEKLEHIFEQFYRLDSSRDSKTGGTGLGLAIAKEIITLHHGEITCDSKEETIYFEIIL